MEQKLKQGYMSSKDLADWFGVTLSTFKNGKAKKLEELKLFADFEEWGGKVYIKKIFEPVYNKDLKKTAYKVKEKIDEVWAKDGLDTCTRVGTKICKDLAKQGTVRKESTIIAYTRQGRNELYGKPFLGGGKIGICEYLWCKKDPATGDLALLTEEEEKIKEKLILKYFKNASEKQIIVKAMIEAGEITKEEAWDILENMTGMDTSNFMDFLGELQAALHCQVIRGTMVTRSAFAAIDSPRKLSEKIEIKAETVENY